MAVLEMPATVLEMPALDAMVGVDSGINTGSVLPKTMLPPYPWFGGKRKATQIIWSRLGDVANYCEPFAGSVATLLGRPHSIKGQVESVNDWNCYVANFWRAVKYEPDAVAEWADNPVFEVDLHAIHNYLTRPVQVEFQRKMMLDPLFYDVKFAGWWIWGVCTWITSEFASDIFPPEKADKHPSRSIPYMGGYGQGLNGKTAKPREMFRLLQQRFRRVRVVCGDWKRLTTPIVTTDMGITGMVLDPPYEGFEDLYTNATKGISAEVRQWCLDNGNNPKFRIALCGYDTEHASMPADWECVPWKANGGHGNKRRDGTNENENRERIWFSPHCLKVGAMQLMF